MHLPDRVESTDDCTEVLRVRNIYVERGKTRVLEGIDFTAHRGRVHVVLGASGSGKSTLLRALIGLVPQPSKIAAETMTLTVNNRQYNLQSSKDLARVRGTHIGLIGQDPALDLTPLRQVRSLIREAIGENKTPMEAVLKSAGLPTGRHISDKRCYELSGGMAQRLALGLAGARKPSLLLADEPSTALDALACQVLAEHLRSVAEQGCAVILVTHDVRLARKLADDITIIDRGAVAEHGTALEVLNAPKTVAAQAIAHPREPMRPATRSDLGLRRREPVLVVKDLKARWNREPVLSGVDVHIDQSEILGLVGRSGGGKSTLVACLVGLLKPSQGTVVVNGRGSESTTWKQLRLDIQLVPQDPRGSLNPWRTIADQIKDPLDVHRIGTGAQRRARVDELLEKVGLEGLGNRRPGALSTGQCQRAAIARALAIRPRLLIADEPVTALDMSLRAEILELFTNVIRTENMASLVISHDLYVVEYLCDRLAVLDQGQIVEELAVPGMRQNARADLTRALLEAHPPRESALPTCHDQIDQEDAPAHAE